VDDVEMILGSSKASFDECLRCVAVSQVAERWDLVERSALRAFTAVDVRRVLDEDLTEAAQHLVSAYLARVPRGHLDALRPAVEEARSRVEREAERGHAASVESALMRMEERLREVLVLLSDTEPASYVRLCSRLRKLHRADLGREAATRCLSPNEQDAKALTTRGAAAADEGDYEAALSDLREAWRVEPSSHAATAAARCLRAVGRLTEALQIAERAVDLEVTSVTVGAYVAAAVAADDAAALNEAQALLARTDDDEGRDDRGHRWAVVVGARTLVRDGQLEPARHALERVLAEGPYSPAEKLLRRVERLEHQKGLRRDDPWG
jgi:tetratricopeptide (TPR) repeat protein